MAAHEDIHAVEDTGVVHHRLGVGRHHLLARRTEDDDCTRSLRAGEVLGDSNGGGDPDRPLRRVLITVEGTFRTAESVVLQDDAEVRRSGRFSVSRDERGLESARPHLHIEVVLAQIIGKELDRPRLLEADLWMTRDVVTEGEELRVHELLGAHCHGVACRARPGQFRNESVHVERSLELIELLHDRPRGIAFGRRLLGGAESRSNQYEHREHDDTGQAHESLRDGYEQD